MSDIKSAREIAMEKLASLGDATEEERLQWKFLPKGRELAGKYIKEEYNILNEITAFNEDEKSYIIRGASEILARNIELPKNDAIRRTNKRMMDGLKTIKTDKTGIENIYSRIRQIFSHYTEQGNQQRKQAYEQLKVQYAAKLQQAMQQQLGTSMSMNIDVEHQPQFQDEWRKLQTQLEGQYVQHLEEFKRELIKIP